MSLGREDELLQRLRRRLAARGNRFLGDDAALIDVAGSLAVTVDQQIESVHFTTGLDPRIVGRRLVRVNLSDLAAVGARPAYAFLTLAVPGDYDSSRLLAGVEYECRRFKLDLAGGDVARSRRTATTMTLIGSRPPGGHWVRRSSAAAGDVLWIGGSLGESAAGRALISGGAHFAGRRAELPNALSSPPALARAARRAVHRHLLPEPQLDLGRWLGTRRRAAAIDVSDGLALDLRRLCRESGVGAELEAASLPLAPGFARLTGALGLDERRLVLGGGEDYVLLFSLPPSVHPPSSFCCRRIGSLLPAGSIHLIQADGSRTELPLSGWDHLRR